MNNANVKLSKTELSLVTDASVILTKNNIIAKVYQLFGGLSSHWQNYVAEKAANLPVEITAASAKIYKGEQYLGLPYVMLDYPRVYTAQHILAIRCFFWWGNFFSITLHLSGRFMQAYKQNLNNWINSNTGQGWFICVNTDAWQHHFGENNYCSIDVMGNTILNETLAAQDSFVKVAKRMPLEQWDDALSFFMKEYTTLMKVIEC